MHDSQARANIGTLRRAPSLLPRDESAAILEENEASRSNIISFMPSHFASDTPEHTNLNFSSVPRMSAQISVHRQGANGTPSSMVPHKNSIYCNVPDPEILRSRLLTMTYSPQKLGHSDGRVRGPSSVMPRTPSFGSLSSESVATDIPSYVDIPHECMVRCEDPTYQHLQSSRVERSTTQPGILKKKTRPLGSNKMPSQNSVSVTVLETAIHQNETATNIDSVRRLTLNTNLSSSSQPILSSQPNPSALPSVCPAPSPPLGTSLARQPNLSRQPSLTAHVVRGALNRRSYPNCTQRKVEERTNVIYMESPLFANRAKISSALINNVVSTTSHMSPSARMHRLLKSSTPIVTPKPNPSFETLYLSNRSTTVSSNVDPPIPESSPAMTNIADPSALSNYRSVAATPAAFSMSAPIPNINPLPQSPPALSVPNVSGVSPNQPFTMMPIERPIPLQVHSSSPTHNVQAVLSINRPCASTATSTHPNILPCTYNLPDFTELHTESNVEGPTSLAMSRSISGDISPSSVASPAPIKSSRTLSIVPQQIVSATSESSTSEMRPYRPLTVGSEMAHKRPDKPRMMMRHNVAGTLHMRSTNRQEYGPLPSTKPLSKLQRSNSQLSCGTRSKKAPRRSGLKYYKNEVFLNVYDLDIVFKTLNDVARRMNTGVYHVGVEAYDVEYAYGSSDSGTGVFESVPQESTVHVFRESIRLGRTNLDEAEVRTVVKNLKTEWQGRRYDLTARNCTHFAEEMASRLGVNEIPTWVKNLSFRLEQIKSFGATNMRRKNSVAAQSMQRKPSIAESWTGDSLRGRTPLMRSATGARLFNRESSDFSLLPSNSSTSRPDTAGYLCGNLNGLFPRLRKMCC